MMDTTINQFLTFTLNEEQYAVPVSKVREVLEYTRITKLPRTSEYMKGIINLRGSGVPVIDLRLKFGMPETSVAKDTAIIVLDVDGGDGAVVVGALADAVHEVVEIPKDQVEPAPRFGTRLAAEFIQGVGKRDDVFIIILDIDRIFNSDEVAMLRSTEAVSPEAVAEQN
ncbi:MAG: chemotaxis protein CheW [Spirochaetes bacterium]|nr:chemotaxis protein CheW [Spirochaetota bacterium]MBU0955650.1 chemotaxis protein CheW [Spirochaetota bacterium]